MTFYQTGIVFALTALVCWGFGDFFIQKTVRTLSSSKALFFIGIIGTIALFPFVVNEISALDGSSLIFLTLIGVVVVFGAIFNFEGLRLGKMAIVEPLLGIELPITVGLAMTLGREQLSLVQILLIAIVFIGIILAITIHHTHLAYHKRIFEKGVIFAGIAAIALGLTTFLVGISSRGISPIMTIWFTHTLAAFVCALYLLYRGEFKTIFKDFKAHPRLILGQSILDNGAWVAYAFSTTFIPISIAMAVSESYIVLAVLLGIFVNREKLRHHQIIGVILAIGGIIALSAFS
ncbi:MAG: EamA family transporter [Candidatus Taylorbacteria bacterium]